MTTKLNNALDNFSNEMGKRLVQKQRAGYSGWSEGDFDAFNIPRRLHDKALDVLIKGDAIAPQKLVDIANFAMFLHYKLTQRKVGE